MDRKKLTLLALAATLLVACTPGEPTEVDLAEARWEESAPGRYRLAVLHVRGIWHAQTVRLEIDGGRIVSHDASCIPAPMEGSTCIVERYRARDYTIAGLFSTIRDVADSDRADFLRVSYHADWGYPEVILIDDPAAYDDELVWRVTSLEVVP